MAKDITLTEGDFGIELEIVFTGTNIDITSCQVETTFITPDKTSLPVEQAQTINATTAIKVIEDKHTVIPGLWTIYCEVVDDDSNITAQEEVYYYVKKYLGGVE